MCVCGIDIAFSGAFSTYAKGGRDTNALKLCSLLSVLPYIIRHTVIRMMQTLPFLLPLLVMNGCQNYLTQCFFTSNMLYYLFFSVVLWIDLGTKLRWTAFHLYNCVCSLNKCNCQSHIIYMITLSWNMCMRIAV